ncbi:hypothetical protein LTR37_020568 [Vermiconidia calcicola]|uniref:Uncharacterized protein n=1 Tax=Vermiconidia calcicola TaxID=1690605 RepID=A0ACC3MDY5_9PEZI|nr:hypothetical protein LTR37_020568 [Vermiconidia calcicola]
MAPLPSPPFVHIDGISNFRDIGGQATSSARAVRQGLVFRSADPTKATADGLKKMSGELGWCLSEAGGVETGITTIFDLRSAPEIKRDGPEWAGTETAKSDIFAASNIHRDWVPVFAEEDYGPEQVALRYKEYTRSGTEGFVQAYHDILLSAPRAYGKIFRHLARQDPSPCLVNCTAGKDRTGILVALLLLFAGLEPEMVAEEYALTELGLAELRPLFIERLLKNPALEGNRDGVQNMVSSKKENMVAAIEMIGKEFEGAETYMREKCGLEDDDIEQLRSNLLGGS